jgi:hypothetical protein
MVFVGDQNKYKIQKKKIIPQELFLLYSLVPVYTGHISDNKTAKM